MTDAELSAAVAQRVLGWEWMRAPLKIGAPLKGLVPPEAPVTTFTAWLPLQGDEIEASDYARWVPPYATDIGACFRDVVPAMRAKGCRLSLADRAEGLANWVASFDCADGVAMERADSPARAICLAALAATDSMNVSGLR